MGSTVDLRDGTVPVPAHGKPNSARNDGLCFLDERRSPDGLRIERVAAPAL